MNHRSTSVEIDTTRSELHQLKWESVTETFEYKNANTLAKIFEKLGISIRFEVRAGKRQIKINGHWKNIDDFNTICVTGVDSGQLYLLDSHLVSQQPSTMVTGKGTGMRSLNALLNEPERRVDSFLVWLEHNIPQWDGIDRLNHLCSDMFDTEPSDLLSWASRYPFIGPIQTSLPTRI